MGRKAATATCAFLLAAALGSCLSAAPARDGAARLFALPPTLKLMPSEAPPTARRGSIHLEAARGEGESSQIVLYAGAADIHGASARAFDLVGPGGYSILPSLGLLGYVPVTKPSFVGFHRRGLFPDPVLPNRPFELASGANQSLWYDVVVPREAPPGRYEGRVEVDAGAAGSFSMAVLLVVHGFELPLTSALRTRVAFRGENFGDERWYGPAWTPEREAALPLLGLRFRFTSPIELPLKQVFDDSGPEGLAPDWGRFDAEAKRWIALGITSFELDPGLRWEQGPEEIRRDFGGRLAAIDAHLVERGWTGLFYFYFYDEPSRSELPELRKRLEAIRAFAPHVPNILTYGITKAGERELLGDVGIWVPNLHQYDPAFAAERRKAGEEVWVYACVANAFRSYPDNFRIDWYGSAHVALGWWLFKYRPDGFLYWAVDLWRRDPWKDGATFPWTNGDGMLFYPSADRNAEPLPSIRAFFLRDAIEVHDLLAALEERYPDAARRSQEVEALLEGAGLVTSPTRFSTDDEAYQAAHLRLLEFLDAQG